jgi:Flp pilus assembly protein TadB
MPGGEFRGPGACPAGGRLQARLATAPWWVSSSVLGACFAALTTAYAYLAHQEDTFGEALARGLIQGAGIGLALGFVLSRQRDTWRRAAGDDLDPDQLRRALKAADRGPLPTEPRMRAAAAAVLRHRLRTVGRHRTLSMCLLAVLVAAAVTAAVVGRTPWGWVASAVLAVVLAAGFVRRRRMRRRLALLER